MNGQPIMPDELIPKALHVIYNVWFLKWRNVRKMTDTDWEKCTTELSRIAEQGDYQLVLDICLAFVTELERRNSRK